MADFKKDDDPWSRRQDSGPPDLMQLIKKFFQGNDSEPSDDKPDNFGKFLGLGVIALVVIWALSGIFLVSPAEEGVITRFGKYVETVGPGPHWIPRIIDSKKVLNVQQVSNFSYQAEMLTKDENIVSVSLAVQYRIADPRAFLFNVLDPVKALQQATSSALRQVVGEMTLDTVLTTGRQQLRDDVSKQLNQIMSLYNTGLVITDVNLQPAQPPEAVTHAFDDAIKAREDEQRYINQAQAYARRVESIVKGKIARLQKSAMAYQQSVVLRAQGATARYLALLKPYEKSPVVTSERMYLDALTNVLSRTTNIVVDGSGNNVLYLPIDQILKQQRMNSSKATNNAASSAFSSDYPALLGDQGSNRPSYQSGDNS